MDFQVLWFVVIAALWTGFFVLEGFDFGVGMLHAVVGRTEGERKLAISTIGPVWDGNEVWLVVAAAAMFAAFPAWYATMFSGLYLVLVLLLLGLIVRGVSFEFRERGEGARWRATWSALLAASSTITPFLLGAALAALLHGLPIGSDQEFTGSVLDLFSPYSILVGVTVVVLCILSGATFLALKTAGEVRARALGVARRLALLTVVLVGAFVVWTLVLAQRGGGFGLLLLVPGIAIIAAAWFVRRDRDGWAFTMASIAMASTVGNLFLHLYPRVMVSSTNPDNSLTIANASSSPYALRVMTISATILIPVVLVYQGWAYYVFRQRVRPAELDAEKVADSSAGQARAASRG